VGSCKELEERERTDKDPKHHHKLEKKLSKAKRRTGVLSTSIWHLQERKK
jgi:hypothetical protein